MSFWVVHWRSTYPAACVMMVSCFAYSSIPKMEASCSSETSVGFQRTARRYIPEDTTFYYLINKSSPLDFVMGQFNSIQLFTPCFCWMHFSYHLRKLSFPLRFSDLTSVWNPHLPHACQALRTKHPPSLIWSRVQLPSFASSYLMHSLVGSLLGLNVLLGVMIVLNPEINKAYDEWFLYLLIYMRVLCACVLVCPCL
jgi:hypothetical protein